MRVELTVSGFADLTATATYGTYIAAETGIEPISSESESDVIPLHYSAIADTNGFESCYEYSCRHLQEVSHRVASYICHKPQAVSESDCYMYGNYFSG